MNLRFKKSDRLLKRRDFTKMSRSSQKRSGKWLFVEIRKVSSPQSCRLGITVTRQFGKSHDRNRFKRLVREAFRLLLPNFTSSFEMVVRPRAIFKNSSQDSAVRDKAKSKRSVLNEEGMAGAMSDEEDRSGKVSNRRIPDEFMKVARKEKHPLAPNPLMMQDVLSDLKGILHDFLPSDTQS